MLLTSQASDQPSAVAFSMTVANTTAASFLPWIFTLVLHATWHGGVVSQKQAHAMLYMIESPYELIYATVRTLMHVLELAA